LDGPTSHHLLRVTGIAPGETVEIFDGAGVAAMAVLEEVVDGCAVLRVCSLVTAPQAARSVWLLPALLRPAAMETVVRMATELGVARITPLMTERVVAKGDKSARWQRIASAAAAQSGRADLPQIDPPSTLEDALASVGEAFNAYICAPGSQGQVTVGDSAAVFIGPEGGWTDAELTQAHAAGVEAMGLGQTVLRADTAAVAALTRLLT
jgi:16S rRNA (uracil1498-N3)-methyltransferase